MNPRAMSVLAWLLAGLSPLAGQGNAKRLPQEAAALLEAPNFRESAFERVTHALWLAEGGLDSLADAARSSGTPQARRVLVEILRAQGDLAQARKEAEALYALAPGAATAELCGRLAEACLDAEAAAGRYRDALGLAPALWPEWVLRTRLALLSFASGDRKAGLEQLQRIATIDRTALAASAARIAGLQGEHEFAAEFAGPVQSANRQRTFLSLLQAAHFQRLGGRLEQAGSTLGEARAMAQSRRERGYVAWAEMELHTEAGTLAELVGQWLAAPALEPEQMLVLVEALASLSRVEEALGLLGRQALDDPVSEEWVSLALSLALESGFEKEALGVLERRLEANPGSLDARLQLSRVLVDLGRMDQAERLWLEALEEGRWSEGRRRLQLCRTIREAGFASLARKTLASMYERAPGDWGLWAGLELARLWREAGKPDEARVLLEAVAGAVGSAPGILRAAGEALEEIGAERQAIAVYRRVLGSVAGEDLQMRLAWLLTRIGEGLEAVEILQDIWDKTQSVSRKRQAENQLLELSAKEGVLGDLADRLEEALEQGRADAAETALLVNLYAKVGDTDSASDVLALFARQGAADRVEAQRRMAQVYLDAGQLQDYENTMRRLLEIDPSGAPEWWMNLAISALERRAPLEAREALQELASLGGTSPAFKAGVLAFAGLHEEAVGAYRAALAEDPGEVETWLLVGRELSAAGRKDEAISLYQFLIDRPGAEDLFVVAVDGLLNLGAPPAVLEWAARRVTEKIALLPTRLFLYRLLGDLLDSIGRKEPSRRVLEEMVPVAAEQRGTVLRELLELAISERNREGVIRWGRRLMALGEVFPPDVFLTVGEALLQEKRWTEAARTFSRAQDALDFVALQRRVARIYLESGRAGQALRILRRLIPQAPEDPSLLGELAEVEGLAGDGAALSTWTRTLQMLIARTPASREAAAGGGRSDRYSLGLHDELWEKAAQGLGASPDRAGVTMVMGELFDRARVEMAELGRGFDLDRAPRLRRILDTLFRLSIATGRSDLIREIAGDLVRAGGGGGAWVAERVEPLLQNGWGRAALGLLETQGSAARADQRWRAEFLFEGRPPQAPAPSLEAGLSLALWELVHSGSGRALAALEGALERTTPQSRLAQAPMIAALRLALDERAGLIGEILALLESPSGSGRRISVYQVRNFLGRSWGILDKGEQEALLDALRRIALNEDEPPAWRALYLFGLLAAGRDAWEGQEFDDLVLSVGVKEGGAEDLVRFLPLIGPQNRPLAIEAIARDKKGYVLVRFLALLPQALGPELDDASMAVLERLYAEESQASSLIGQFCRPRSASEPPIPPDRELALLDALERRMPGDANILAARFRCLLAADRQAQARDLARGLISGPKGIDPLLGNETLRRLVEDAAGPMLREGLLEAARGGSAPALLALVREHARRGERQQALALLESLASRFASNAAVFQARYDLLRALGRHVDAGQELVAYVGSAAGLQPHWFLRAASELQGMGRHRDALKMIARYSPGGSSVFDHGALQRLRYLALSPPSPERNRQILGDLRRMLSPDSRGYTSLVVQFRQIPLVALPAPGADESPTPLMLAAEVPGALAELEGFLTILPGLPRVSHYTPWELFAAVAWAHVQQGRNKEFLAAIEALLAAEPAEGRALRLGNMAAAWMPEARRADWALRGLAMQMATGLGGVAESAFWCDRLERAGLGEAAGRLVAFQLLHSLFVPHYQARDTLRGLLRLESSKAVPDDLVVLALASHSPLGNRRAFGSSGLSSDLSLLEEALAAGRHDALFRLVPEFEALLAEEPGSGGDRLRLILAAASLRAGDRERALTHFRAFLADPDGDGSLIPFNRISELLPVDTEALLVVGRESAAALQRVGTRKRDFLARLVALVALRLGDSEHAPSLWEAAEAVALAGEGEGREALGRIAFEEGRPDLASPLLLPLFAEGRIHHAQAAAVCSALAEAGADARLLAKGVRAYLDHCPRADLALQAARLLPAAEARAALEAALQEDPEHPELSAALGG